MKFFSPALVAAAVVPLVSASQFVNLYDVSEPTNIGFIIELDHSYSLSKRDVHSEFHRQARSLADYSVRHEFKNPKYFYGLSVDAADVSALASLPEVKNIWPNRLHDRPRPYGAPVPAAAVETNAFSDVHVKRDNALLPHIVGSSDINHALKMTSVDEVHKLNITGKGVKIGIVDSGIDYRHPALGGGFGPGFKVAGGYDLVGEDYDGTNTPIPDNDPLASCLEGGHGTHVAGIIGAQDPEGVGFGVLGVAPDAELHMYRIFGCLGSASDDIMMQALEMAAEDGVDLISMSVGYANIWETGSPYKTLLAGIRDKGVGLVISAGNDGERGPYFASEPALEPSVIAVASVDNDKFVTVYNGADSNGETIEYAKVLPFADSGPYHVFTTPGEETSCTADTWLNLTAGYTDKEHLIALISPTSQCSWQLTALANKTGITNIWWAVADSANFRVEAPGDQPGVHVAQLRLAASDKVRAGIEAQGAADYTVSFADREVHDATQATPGAVSIFSTFGPTMEMSLKPQLGAPGGNILSTWPITDGNGYALISGTSMSTPHTAGVYALVKQAHPTLSPEQIAQRLQNSATPLTRTGTDGTVLTSTAQQGAGMINALRAITYETRASPTELNLRDSAAPPVQSLTIENGSGRARTYALGHRSAAAVDALPQVFDANVNNVWRWVSNGAAAYASVEFSSDSVEVAAGATATVEVRFAAPADLDPAKLPVYGGYITITSSDDDSSEEVLVVPYAGVPYERASIAVLDTTNLTTGGGSTPPPPAGVPELPYLRSFSTGERDNDLMTFTFPAPANGSGGVDNNPQFVGSIRQPCSYARFDVVAADTDFVPTAYGFDPAVKPGNGTALSSPPVDGLDDFLGVASYGAFATIVGGHDKPVNPWQWYWRGYGAISQPWEWATVALANGTVYQLPNADYRVLFRALRYGYDYEDPAGYDSWLSPVVRVRITDPGYPNPLLPA